MAPMLQFLQAVRHSVGAHTDTLEPRNDSSSSSEDDDEDDVSQAPVPAATTSERRPNQQPCQL